MYSVSAISMVRPPTSRWESDAALWWMIAAAAVARLTGSARALHVETGNEAIARGAMEAGLGFFAGYPITPWSDVMELLRRELPKYGGSFVQCEDEIASISMALGASYAGRVAGEPDPVAHAATDGPIIQPAEHLEPAGFHARQAFLDPRLDGVVRHGEVEAFLADKSDKAFAKVVDRLLARGILSKDTHGTVVRSWLLELLAKALAEDPEFAEISGYTEDSGEGRWTVQAAIDGGIGYPCVIKPVMTDEDAFAEAKGGIGNWLTEWGSDLIFDDFHATASTYNFFTFLDLSNTTLDFNCFTSICNRYHLIKYIFIPFTYCFMSKLYAHFLE